MTLAAKIKHSAHGRPLCKQRFGLGRKPSSDNLMYSPDAALIRYSSLISQLGQETDRKRKLAILEELASIAKNYYGHPKKVKGSTVLDEALAPVSKFIIRNMQDWELVSAAVEVLKRTGTRAQVIKKLDELSNIAKSAGKSRVVLAKAYLDFVTL